MKLRAALAAVAFAVSMSASAAVVDKTEPPATPAGGRPEAGIGVAGAVGIAIGVGILIAVVGGDDDDDSTTTTTTTAP